MDDIPRHDASFRPEMSAFGNIIAGISIRGALEAIAGKSRTFIMFNDAKGKPYPIPKVRFEWHDLLFYFDITFFNFGGWAYELVQTQQVNERTGANISLNDGICNLMTQALEALKAKMESGKPAS